MTETRLLILRHGKTEMMAASGQDFDRALVERGIRNSRAMGEVLAREHPRPDVVLVSPAMRARQTADYALAAAQYDPAPAIIHDDRIYGASPAGLLAVIGEHAGQCRCALLIGHNPGLLMLAEGLLAEAERGPGSLPTCGLVDIAFPAAATLAEAGEGTGSLRAMHRPREMGMK